MPYTFMKGLELSRLFYQEAVAPILAAHFPDLAYAAARLDSGSDVLGFDTPRSMDHGWGPRLMLFLAEDDFDTLAGPIDQTLRAELPLEFRGFPTNFSPHEDKWMVPLEAGPVNHWVSLHTCRAFFIDYLRYDPDQALDPATWLTFPQQRLRTVTVGPIFHAGLARLEAIRARLSYYPPQLWLYLLANQWQRISQEEAFVGRSGHAGDELGSRLIAARLIHDLMGLCFLLERVYAPYAKWFGTAFAQLPGAAELTPLFQQALSAQTWPEREQALSSAYELIAARHNRLGLTEPLPAKVSQFHSRPYLVIQAGDFAEAIRRTITDPVILALPPHLGAIDQYVNSTDVLSDPAQFEQFRALYRPAGSA